MDPEKIGRYEILRPLAQGGMGTTWLARDPELDRVIVVKGLRAEATSSTKERERLVREARLLAGLGHPNIVHVYDLVEQDGQWFICMQQAQGRTLRDLLRDGPLPLAQVHRIAMGVTTAMVAAHEAGVIHRDIKPENIMVTDEGDALVLDFGIAWKPADFSPTTTTMSAGTLLAMSPEQVAGQAPDRRSDLFSMGSLLYEMATGRHPFQGNAPAEVGYHILNSAPPSPSTLRAGLPVELVHAISKCLEKDPALRYQHADELRADLQRLGRELQGGHADVAPVPESWSGAPDAQTRIAAHVKTLVPALPPLPGRAALTALVVGGALAAAALLGFRPEPYRTTEGVRLDLAGAEAAARAFLERQGVALYGFGARATSDRDDDLRRYERYLRLTGEQCASLQRWRVPVWTSVLFVSPDRQGRFEVHLDNWGRPSYFSHDPSPDYRPLEAPLDSAYAVADRMFRSEFRFPTGGRLSRPTEPHTVDKHLRDYWWLAGDSAVSLPGGASARFKIRTSGSMVIFASRGLDLPPIVTRRYAQSGSWQEGAKAVVFILFLIGTVAALRQGRFDRPNLRFLMVTFTLVLGLGLLHSSSGLREEFISSGIGAALFSCCLNVLGALFVGAAAPLVMGVILGTLREEDPRLLAGIADFLRLRVSSRAWACAAVVGIPLGLLVVSFNRFVPWGVQQAGLGSFMPDYQYPGTLWAGLGLLDDVGFRVLSSPVICGSALVVTALARRWLRIGVLAWLLVLVGASFVLRESPPVLQPIAFDLAWSVTGLAVFFGAALRFGVLTGAIALGSAGLLTAAVQFAGAQATSLRVSGLVVVGLCLVALALALNALRAPRDAAPRPSPSTAA